MRAPKKFKRTVGAPGAILPGAMRALADCRKAIPGTREGPLLFLSDFKAQAKVRATLVHNLGHPQGCPPQLIFKIPFLLHAPPHLHT
jgi:hypothetical protein